MLSIEGDRITVMAARRIVPLAKTDRVVSKSYEATLNEMEGRMQLWITRESGGFFFPRLRRLMWTKYNWRFSSQRFRAKQKRGHGFTLLGIKHDFLEGMSFLRGLFRDSRSQWWLQLRWFAEKLSQYTFDFVSPRCPRSRCSYLLISINE